METPREKDVRMSGLLGGGEDSSLLPPLLTLSRCSFIIMAAWWLKIDDDDDVVTIGVGIGLPDDVDRSIDPDVASLVA